jgi:hypothetical protein
LRGVTRPLGDERADPLEAVEALVARVLAGVLERGGEPDKDRAVGETVGALNLGRSRPKSIVGGGYPESLPRPRDFPGASAPLPSAPLVAR